MAIVFAVVTITFFVVHLAHGKPCGSDDRPLPPEICQALCRRFGCDKPLLEQYGKYLAALARGDLGESIGLHRPVADALADAIPNTFTLALVGAASTARYQRAAMLEVVRQDYVRTARAKGLREQRVLLVHALRNALLPIITLFGLAFPFLFTGAVLIETVFAWPGMGRLAVNAIFQRDYPVVTGAALLTSAMVVLGNLIADALYAVADPRIRVRGGEGGP